MREGGDKGAKNRSQLRGNVRGSSDGEEGGFVVVNGQTNCTFKDLKDFLSGDDSFRRATDEDQSVVSILNDRARFIRGKGMADRGS